MNRYTTRLIAINTAKAKGADNISAKAIRVVAGQIAPSVAYLFNESFRLGTFPSACKLAHVSPLHKGGDSSNRDNQQPISILPCLSKLYEGLANLQLQDYACESKMISDKQFAYKKFSSCNVALILLIDEWKWAIDNKQLTVAAFLDLRKAFDVINHRLLLSKLKNGGISGMAIQWLESYLKDRKQYVCWNGYCSDVLSVEHGVPQGSVLGPTLFSIYYDSVQSVITNSSCRLFADDTEIHSSNSIISRAVENVNEDLVSVEKWLIENEMVAHPKKSEVMKIGSRPALMNAGDVVVNLNSQIPKEVSAYKYLGVLMDTLLTWNKHLSYICKRVYPKLCLLNRTS